MEKRERIIEVAKWVLAENGLEGCTVRAVAAAGPLSKSAIHYYFRDMDELVDQAMVAHISTFVQAIRSAVAARTEPLERFWAAVETYLTLFSDRPRAILLWHEYWLHCLRQNRLSAIDDMVNEVTQIFLDLLSEVKVDEAPKRARMLTSYLIGAATRQPFTERPLDAVKEEIGLVCSVH